MTPAAGEAAYRADFLWLVLASVLEEKAAARETQIAISTADISGSWSESQERIGMV